MSLRRVTVFGGTGFLGRRIVRHLQDADFAVWIASRHLDRRRSLFSGDVSGIDTFRADVNDDGSVASADSNLYGAFPVKWSFLVCCSSLFGAGKPFFIPSPTIRFAERAEGVKGPKR